VIDPIRIGYVVKRYPRYSETFIVNEILAHEAAGAQIDVFSLRPPCDTHFQDVIARVRAPVHYLPHAGLKVRDFWDMLSRAQRKLPGLPDGLEQAWGQDVTEVHQAVELATKVRELGIAHLHAHFATSPASVARLAARFAGIAYSYTAHAKDIFHEDVDPLDLRRKQRDAAAVITVSDFNVRHLRELDPASGDNVTRLYNGLDLNRFEFDSPAERPLRIAAVGRLVEKKGFSDLIDACSELAKEGLEVDCRIIGTGPLEPELRQQIERLGLGAKVVLPGPQPQSVVRDELRAAAVFAAPCVVAADGNRDGLPTTLLESMAMGTPCISTDVTGIPEMIQHEKTGLIVPQHDPAALAGAIRQLLGDPAQRVRLATNARRLIEEEFDVVRNTATQREIFRTASGADAGDRLAQGAGR
jgi:colanic acid/amylovoran biosynthesis glycosyltransferase